ncbi:MAG TPA: DUF1254 domain-containing protein [Acidimicrobiia bacterium]
MTRAGATRSRRGRARRRGVGLCLVAGALLAATPATASPASGAASLRTEAAAAAQRLGAADPAAAQAAIEAYVWGIPLVTMVRTRARTLCLAPVNTLLKTSSLAGPSNRLVVTPNADTLYANAWLDLRPGPVVLQVPASDHYYVFQFLDMYTNTIANVGTRTNQGAAGRYAITGPGWHGSLPAGVRRISSPTPDVWVIGRTLVTSSTDLAAAVAQQRGDTLSPLGGPPASTRTPGLGGCAAATASNATFLTELGTAMAADPPPPRDQPIVSDLAAVGIGSGLTPSAALTPGLVSQAVAAGTAVVDRTAAAARLTRDGWSNLPSQGTYGTDYVARAATTAVGLGANVPAESVYFHAGTDASGAALSGASGYHLHFAASALPPIDRRAFWSLTAYGPDHFLVANAINRYSIGDRTTGLRYGVGGSLDLYVGPTAPAGHEANWLPAPPGPFSLIFRAYLPGARIRSGAWAPPPIQPA